MNDSSSLTCPFPIEAKSLELIDLYNYHLLVSVENVLLFNGKLLSFEFLLPPKIC